MTSTVHATLLIVNGPGRGTRYEVYADDGEAIIGRSVGTRIRVPDSEVSRQHAKLSFDGKNFVVTDLLSVNGTFVSGKKIDEHRLKSDDTIRVGRTRLLFRMVGEAPQQESVANVRFLEDSPSGQHSAIVEQLVDDQSSSAPAFPDRSGLDLLYKVAEELVRPVEHHESPAGDDPEAHPENSRCRSW